MRQCGDGWAGDRGEVQLPAVYQFDKVGNLAVRQLPVYPDRLGMIYKRQQQSLTGIYSEQFTLNICQLTSLTLQALYMSPTERLPWPKSTKKKDSHSPPIAQSKPEAIISQMLQIIQSQENTNLEPSPSLRSRLESITISAMRIIPSGARIRSPITLSTRLNPDKGILQRVASVSGRSDTEASTFHIAPVAPGVLLCWLDAVAA